MVVLRGKSACAEALADFNPVITRIYRDRVDVSIYPDRYLMLGFIWHRSYIFNNLHKFIVFWNPVKLPRIDIINICLQ